MIIYLDEFSEYALFHYEEWMKDIKRKYKYGINEEYDIGSKVKYIHFSYISSKNKLQACEIIGFIINNKNKNYNIKRYDIVYENISYKNLKKFE